MEDLGASERRKALTRMCTLASGMIVAFVTYGVFQERIMQSPFPRTKAAEAAETAEGNDAFRNTAFLVFLNRVVASGVAAIALIAGGYRKRLIRAGSATQQNQQNGDWHTVLESLRPVAPIHMYLSVAASNVVATWCQYEALKHVSFALQTLCKTGKMIPVMAIGVLLHGKHYAAREVAANVLITAGCTAFMMSGEVASGRTGSVTAVGVLLMVVYLCVDGFTSTLQERLFHGYSMTAFNQMLHVNLCSSALSAVFLLASGGMRESIQFASSHSGFLFSAVMLSLCAAVGQALIYSVIREFGAIVYAGIMVTRQVISVVVSCAVFMHPLTLPQVGSAFLVFVSLFYLESRKSRSRHTHQNRGAPAVLLASESPSLGIAIPIITVTDTSEQKQTL